MKSLTPSPSSISWKGAFSLLFVSMLLATPNFAQETSEEEAEETEKPRTTFLDEVTVTATQSPASLRETPGQVDVISEDEIQDQMFENLSDLVKFEPGVYVENDVTRLGLNGFNIRGIGGNRVLTQVDGIQASEQFDFGPFSVHNQGIDLDALKSVEIVRSAGSALYGSDALGGVVSLLTKDPKDYLGSENTYLGAKFTFDGRSQDSGINLTGATQRDRFSSSLFISSNSGEELDNQGENGGEGLDRDQPNPQDRSLFQALGKFVVDVSDSNELNFSVEINDTDVDTEVLSGRGSTAFGPTTIATNAVNAEDHQERFRLGVRQNFIDVGVDSLSWQLNVRNGDTSQVVFEDRVTSGFGPPTFVDREGSLEFEQLTYNAIVRAREAFDIGANGSGVLSFGISYLVDDFDMLRDRTDINVATGEVIPASLVFPTKYFPESETTESGAYAQAELSWGRVTLIPGVRYDRFELDVNEQDTVYLLSGGLPPEGFDDDAFSPKLGAVVGLTDSLTLTAQYARGFRAPPYSAVNTGFTNLAGGYQTLANPDLEAESSDNFELGLRGNFGRTSWSVNAFNNQYDEFIELQVTGFNPFLNVIEFQNVNLTEVEIEGVELQVESYLGDNFLLRASYADIEGNNVTGEEDVALGSVAPNEGVLGLRYFADSGRWGLDGSVRFVADRTQDEAGEGQFAPDSYEVLDIVAFFDLPANLSLRLGVLNATDETFFEWWNVRGRSAQDPRLGLFTSPGRNVIGSISYAW
ncbi:MAG: TonB-dependent hemoglobin/transferrin/lactoferrin family receptor [Acidobacteriota bacterium]